MKKLILILAITFSFIATKAQDNPFAEYGYTPKIATLSNGQFVETFDNDTIVQIGSIWFNTMSQQIVGFVERDTLNPELNIEPDLVSRWISPDPMAYKFPDKSPYNYVNNNPILFIDPDGREPAINQAGTIAQAIAQWRTMGLTTVQDIMNFTTSKISNGADINAIRYVYTENNGWIDLQHYFGVQHYGKSPMDMLEALSGIPALQDNIFGKGADKSYYSYENLPTNEFSSQVDINNLSGDELLEAVINHFGDANATNPSNAPNYNAIPNDDQDRSRIPEVKSVKKAYNSQQGHYQNTYETYSDKEKNELLKSGNYIPQNHTSKPYDLEGFTPASTSLQNR